MKPDEKHTAYIREAWSQMLTKEDLLALLNYAKPLAYESKTVPFELKQLTWYANPKINSRRYSTFSIKKKSGSERTIHAPVEGLKAIQKTLAYILQCVHEPHKAAMGFVRDRSIVDNARLHEGQKYIYNIDLKDFFPSVDQARVWKCLQLPPLNLNNQQRKDRQWFQLIHPGIGSVTTSKGEVIFYKIDQDRNKVQLLKNKGDYKAWIERVEQIAEEHAIPAQKIIADSLTLLIKEKYTKLLEEADRSKLANVIAAICCTEMEVERKNEQEEWVKVKRNVLPQGAPTSPVVTNIVCQKLDFLLSGVTKRFGLRYSRYADDITFSSMHNVYQNGSEFVKELQRIIKQQGFHIKESKTRLQKEGFRQEVTGLVVNERVNVQKHYKKQLRMWLYYWEQYGYERASSFFLQQYIVDKGPYKGKPEMAKVISGKLDYLRMVQGGSRAYLTLKERFDNLKPKTNFVFQTFETSKTTQTFHKPAITVDFLKSFKYDDKYSFKDLVHLPVGDNRTDYLKVLRRANKEFLDILHSNTRKVKLPKYLIEDVQHFFGKLSTKGLQYFEKTGLHPLENKEIGAVIQEFKRNYRFGNERSESSILSEMITNIAKRRTFTDQEKGIVFSFGNTATSPLFNIEQLIFYPDLEKFQAKANFFSWVPSVKIALTIIFDGILKHSNVQGNRNFLSQDKNIIFQLKRFLDGDVIKIEFSILDKGSVFLGTLNHVLKDLRRDFFSVLVGLCDFRVQFQTLEGESYECSILPFSEQVMPIENSVGGFNYVFTFYD
ncbi:RNA-directed DNA polymerase [Flavisolibacter sp. BT320]|nr:RNA-directed DNA polymerase [Flavisolibacter longurius]